MNLLFVLGTFLFLAQACTIEKRSFRSGYNVQSKKIYAHNQSSQLIREKNERLKLAISKSENKLFENNTFLTVKQEDLVQEMEVQKETAARFVVKENDSIQPNGSTHDSVEIKCDSVFLKTGEILLGVVEEITLSEIKYRRCDNVGGPLIYVDKKNVRKIKYGSGSEQVINRIKTEREKKMSIESILSASFGIVAIILLTGLLFSGWAAELFLLSIPAAILALIFGILGILVPVQKKDDYNHKTTFAAVIGLALALGYSIWFFISMRNSFF